MLAVCEALRLLFSSMVSEHCIRFRELWKTTRRAESSSQVGKSPVYEDVPKIEVSVPSLILCESNHRHWSMKMEVHTEAQALWEVAHGTKLISIKIDVHFQSNERRTRRFYRVLIVGLDRVVQSRVRCLK